MKFVIGRRAEYSPQPKECFVIEVEQSKAFRLCCQGLKSAQMQTLIYAR